MLGLKISVQAGRDPVITSLNPSWTSVQSFLQGLSLLLTLKSAAPAQGLPIIALSQLPHKYVTRSAKEIQRISYRQPKWLLVRATMKICANRITTSSVVRRSARIPARVGSWRTLRPLRLILVPTMVFNLQIQVWANLGQFSELKKGLGILKTNSQVLAVITSTRR